MLLSLGLPRSLVRESCGMVLFAAFAICSEIGGQALAQAPYDDTETAEGWAWARIKEGRKANFNERCGTPALDPRADEETGWTNSCRQISATFLVDILTRTPSRNQVPSGSIWARSQRQAARRASARRATTLVLHLTNAASARAALLSWAPTADRP